MLSPIPESCPTQLQRAKCRPDRGRQRYVIGSRWELSPSRPTRRTERMNSNTGLPQLPARIDRLGELARDLWWSWHYRARDVFRTLDYPLWRLTSHNPVRMLRLIPPERLEQVAADPAFVAAVRPGAPGPRRGADGEEHLVGAGPSAIRPNGKVAYFSRRVRVAPVASHLRGRPRRARRRHLQGSAATSACRWWASASCTRRVTSTSTSRPTAGSRKSTTQVAWDDVADRARAAPGRVTRASSRCRSGTARCSSRCGWCGPGGSGCTCWTPTSRRTRPWDRELSARLYGGNHETRIQQEIDARPRRRAGAARARHRTRPSGTSTKGTRRS